MSKELKKELFHFYDMVIFEDENGITQDYVCAIRKDRIIDEIVDVIECNNHIISLYGNDGYRVWKEEGKNGPYCGTNKKIIHLYTLKNDNRYYEIYPTDDYAKIDSSNHNEALETLKDMLIGNGINDNINDYVDNLILPIKQALIKAQSNEYKLAFDLINKKRVDIKLLHWAYPSCKAYNDAVREKKEYWPREELTEEEFEFIGRLAGAR